MVPESDAPIPTSSLTTSTACSVPSTPATVDIEIDFEGQALVVRSFTPTYTDVRNEPQCEVACRVFSDQQAVQDAFKAGELDRDVVVVVRFQGPRANGMPELHKLTPPLGVLQNKGHRVALVTDGRMSGASGKVPAAIHLSPEAIGGGPIGKLRDGDVVRLCAEEGILQALVDPVEWDARELAAAPPPVAGLGRELFAMMRAGASEAEAGGSAMLAAAEL